MKFLIDTDLTTEGTKISVDGKNVADERKVASVSFFADAPNKKYQEDGYISLSVTSFDDEGNMKRESFSKRAEEAQNIVPMGLQDEIKFDKDDVIRFIGDSIDTEKKTLVDSIIEHCSTNKIACPDSEILLNRSTDSLRDKANDLGIASADA